MSAVATRPAPWSDTAIEHLQDAISCPRCAHHLHDRHCARCGADYTGAIGSELWTASQTAIDALRARQAVLDRVPTRALAPSLRRHPRSPP